MTAALPSVSIPPAGLPRAEAEAAAAAARVSTRIVSIDGLRGLVMLLMLVDHTREFFFFGHQVADPMDSTTIAPGLFFTRLAAHLCAPVFVALTGLAAWLYGQGRPPAATAAFLFKRGLFLIALELTVVGFGWSFALPPPMVFLQVIWAIGWSMIALAAIVHLPRGWIAAIGATIVIGHNALDPITYASGTPGHALWAIVHDRGIIDLWEGTRARTSYPVLPWIGVIALGYAIGPWFAAPVPADRRVRRLVALGIALLGAFCLVRWIDVYGDPTPWRVGPTPLRTAMAFLNVTKYPPSLDFLLLTLGAGALLLGVWPARRGGWLAVLGGAPLFFYILHIYALHLLRVATGGGGDLPSIGWVWLVAAAMTPALWLATRWFATRKRVSARWWMRYL